MTENYVSKIKDEKPPPKFKHEIVYELMMLKQNKLVTLMSSESQSCLAKDSEVSCFASMIPKLDSYKNTIQILVSSRKN